MSEQEKAGGEPDGKPTRRITISITPNERIAVLQRSQIRQFKDAACSALQLFAEKRLEPVTSREQSRCRKQETSIRLPADLVSHVFKRIPYLAERDLPGVIVRLILALPPVPSEVRRLPRRRKAILSDRGRRLAALIWIGQNLEAVFDQCSTDAVSGNELARLLEELAAIAVEAERLATGGSS